MKKKDTHLHEKKIRYFKETVSLNKG